MEAYNTIIYLYGHKHFASSEISNNSKHLFIGAGTPSGVESDMTFNIIEIENSEEQIDVSIIVNSVENDNISMATNNHYVYSKVVEQWMEN